MRILSRISTAFIAISLILPLLSGTSLIVFVQQDRIAISKGDIHGFLSYENFVHEAGFARLAISIMVLLILFIPYRRGERWALVALTVFGLAYYIPVFVFGAFPNMGMWPVFRNLPRQQNWGAWAFWSSYMLAGLLVLGLIMSLVASIPARRNTTL